MHSKYLSFYPQVSVVLTIYQRHSVLQQMETFTETSQTAENKSLQNAQPQLVHLQPNSYTLGSENIMENREKKW